MPRRSEQVTPEIPSNNAMTSNAGQSASSSSKFVLKTSLESRSDQFSGAESLSSDGSVEMSSAHTDESSDGKSLE